MDRTGLLIRAGGFALLLIGLAFPWVVFDSPEVREENIHRVESLLSEERVPPELLERLVEMGVTVELSSEQIWILLGREEFRENYNYVENNDWLFFWDFFLIQSTGMTRVAIGSVLIATVVTFAALILNFVQGNGRSFITYLPTTSLRWTQAGIYLIALLLLLITSPTLDSFGYAGEWGMSWLDVLSGAKATIVPRILIPLGLILLIFGIVLRLTQSRSISTHDDYYVEYGDTI